MKPNINTQYLWLAVRVSWVEEKPRCEQKKKKLQQISRFFSLSQESLWVRSKEKPQREQKIQNWPRLRTVPLLAFLPRKNSNHQYTASVAFIMEEEVTRLLFPNQKIFLISFLFSWHSTLLLLVNPEYAPNFISGYEEKAPEGELVLSTWQVF